MVRGRGGTQFIAARLSGRRPATSGSTSPCGLAYLLPIHGKLCSHDEPPPRPGAWPSDGLSLGAMTAAMWVRTICRYRSVSVILHLWSLVRVGSFQMNLRMYRIHVCTQVGSLSRRITNT